jgi:hypothetical protein
MERRTLRRARLALVVAIALVVIGAGALWQARRRGGGPAEIPRNVRAPEGQRVRVQVLNGTKTRGLARRATMLLRDRGFDVLETGNGGEPRDTSIVYDLTGHPEWAARVAKLFPPARVDTRPDSSRYLDVVLVIGTAWRAPAEPFHP